jgi:hypothetical protein
MLMKTFPSMPVDQYVISGFTVEQDREHCPVIVTLKYIYHVNTPWAKIGNPVDRGADLVDCWQVISNGKFVGRYAGWAKAQELIQGFFFRTRKGAVISAQHMIDDSIRDHQVRIDQLTKARKALTKGAER